jgi:hypothetical protein
MDSIQAITTDMTDADHGSYQRMSEVITGGQAARKLVEMD